MEKYTTGYVRALICVLVFEEIQVLKLINPRKQHVEKLNRLAKKCEVLLIFLLRKMMGVRLNCTPFFLDVLFVIYGDPSKVKMG